MSDDEAAPRRSSTSGGGKEQPNIVEPSSLDRRNSPAIAALVIQETTVHEIQEVQVELLPLISETSVATFLAPEFVTETKVCCVGNVHSCFAFVAVSGKKEDVARRSCSCTVKRARSVLCCATA